MRRPYTYCRGRNKDGRPCGNKVPTFASGVYVKSSLCHVHQREHKERDAGAEG